MVVVAILSALRWWGLRARVSCREFRYAVKLAVVRCWSFHGCFFADITVLCCLVECAADVVGSS